MRVIEFQKRFPLRTHAHYLTTVKCNEKAQKVDQIVSAEIPQVQKHPFETSTTDEPKRKETKETKRHPYVRRPETVLTSQSAGHKGETKSPEKESQGWRSDRNEMPSPEETRESLWGTSLSDTSAK